MRNSLANLFAGVLVVFLALPLFGQSSLRHCPHGQRVGQCSICFGSRSSSDDEECASARNHLLALARKGETTYTESQIKNMGCSMAKLAASNRGWKSRDDLEREARARQRDAEEQAQKAKRDAEQRAWDAKFKAQQDEWAERRKAQEAEQAQRELREKMERKERDRVAEAEALAKRRAKDAEQAKEEARINDYDDTKKELEELERTYRGYLYDPNFVADEAKVRAQINKIEAVIDALEKDKYNNLSSTEIVANFGASLEASSVKSTLESILRTKTESKWPKPMQPRLPTGDYSPGQTVKEYGKQLENSTKQVGALETYIVGPAKGKIERIGKDMKPMLNPQPSSGGGGTLDSSVGSPAPSLPRTPSQPWIAPTPAPYVNPLSGLEGFTGSPVGAQPQSANDLKELLDLVDQIGQDKPAPTPKPSATQIEPVPPSSSPNNNSSANGKSPANPSLMDLIKSFEKNK